LVGRQSEKGVLVDGERDSRLLGAPRAAAAARLTRHVVEVHNRRQAGKGTLCRRPQSHAQGEGLPWRGALGALVLTVRARRRQSDGRVFAVKIIKKNALEQTDKVAIQNEVAVMYKVRARRSHPRAS
jgi:hypothetical protein